MINAYALRAQKYREYLISRYPLIHSLRFKICVLWFAQWKKLAWTHGYASHVSLVFLWAYGESLHVVCCVCSLVVKHHITHHLTNSMSCCGFVLLCTCMDDCLTLTSFEPRLVILLNSFYMSVIWVDKTLYLSQICYAILPKLCLLGRINLS